MKRRRKRTSDRKDFESQFIAMVQTGLLIYYAANSGDGTAPLSRPCWAIEHLDDAYKVAPTIPADVTASEAATAFVTWVIERNSLDDEQREILSILLGS